MLNNEIKDKVNALNKLVMSGDIVKAMELYFSDDVEMQENDDPPRKGKSFCLEQKKESLKKAKKVECKLLNHAIDEAKGVVFGEWEILVTYPDDSKIMLVQVTVQYWSDGQVVKEKYYYKNIHYCPVLTKRESMVYEIHLWVFASSLS